MTPHEKLHALNTLARRDARHEAVRELTGHLLNVAELLGHRELVLHLIHAVARDGIRYQTDTARTGGEDIAGLTRAYDHPLTAAWRGKDDCDAKARLFVALAIAAGYAARVAGLIEADVLTHVYPEVWRGGTWTPAETTLSRARLGDPPREVPKESSGRWLYA
jgi:transglutaminase-like putative cysteine protease